MAAFGKLGSLVKGSVYRGYVMHYLRNDARYSVKVTNPDKPGLERFFVLQGDARRWIDKTEGPERWGPRSKGL